MAGVAGVGVAGAAGAAGEGTAGAGVAFIAAISSNASLLYEYDKEIVTIKIISSVHILYVNISTSYYIS
jgi:hypothetical protein